MNSAKLAYQKYSDYGPGGRNCNCCGPSPRDRKIFDRTVKRRERQIYKKDLRNNYGI